MVESVDALVTLERDEYTTFRSRFLAKEALARPYILPESTRQLLVELPETFTRIFDFPSTSPVGTADATVAYSTDVVDGGFDSGLLGFQQQHLAQCPVFEQLYHLASLAGHLLLR